MDRKGNISLALCLLAVGAVDANEGPNGTPPRDPAAGIMVPNIPPDLVPPELAAAPAAPDSAADNAPVTAVSPDSVAGNAPVTAVSPDATASNAPVTAPHSGSAWNDVPAAAVPWNNEPATAPAAKSASSNGQTGRTGSATTTKASTSRPQALVVPINAGLQVDPPSNVGRPAQTAIEQSYEWAENPDAMPVRDAGGRVLFPKGSNPTIVCAPLRVCDIELEAGETVQGAPHIGDSIRWKISPAVSGVGDQAVTHLIVKPTEPGLDTNLIIPTDRSTYHIRLVSSAVHYVSSVAFDDPEEQQKVWEKLPKAGAGSGSADIRDDVRGDMPIVAVNHLNFNYKIKVVKGKPSFKPLRAMDDGYHTYIAMNEELPQGEAPALIGISSRGEEQMINYRLKGNLYVVDGTIFKLALISGVGRDQQRVELTRNPCRNRGWLGICWDPKE